jgi:hypothetical protein
MGDYMGRLMPTLVVLSLAGCNPSLTAEKEAYARWLSQKELCKREHEECVRGFNLEPLTRAQNEAAVRCARLEKAAEAVLEGGTLEERVSIQRIVSSDPKCVEYQTLTQELGPLINRADLQCSGLPCDTELDVLRKESMAACLKCAIKERCTLLLEKNQEQKDPARSEYACK